MARTDKHKTKYKESSIKDFKKSQKQKLEKTSRIILLKIKMEE